MFTSVASSRPVVGCYIRVFGSADFTDGVVNVKLNFRVSLERENFGRTNGCFQTEHLQIQQLRVNIQ